MVLAVGLLAAVSECNEFKWDCNGGEPGKDTCVQLECFLNDEGVPTMRIFIPNLLNTCTPNSCQGRIGPSKECDKVAYTDSEREGFMKKDVQAGECGTKFKVAAKDLEYTNVLNLFELSDDETIVRGETEWRLKCTYPREQLKTTSFDTNRKVDNITEPGHIPNVLEIFDCDYEAARPSGPFIYALKDKVCVQASMPTHDDLELFPVKCWATVGSDPAANKRKDLIVNGCGVEDTLTLDDAKTPVKKRFSFDAFRFMDEGTCKVYVHCDLLICDAGDANSRCKKGCVESRKKRSITNASGIGGSFLSSKMVTIGPIIVGDTQKDAHLFIKGIDRMARLKAVGQKLNWLTRMRQGRKSIFGN